jgi:2,4-dienoyl-CoA reductase-like NADH-dependent reductase (Old Yellow Enzyme family)
VEATREAAGDDLAVLVKTNLRDGFEGGIELDEAIAFARILEGAGAHALVLSAGFVSRAPMEVMGGAMPTKVMGALMGDALGKAVSAFGQWLIRPVPFRETYFLEDAKAVRAAVALPLVYVGGATSRAGIDRALAAGFDAVAIARALIRETDFVARLERDPGATSPCDHCNYCAARIYTTSMSCHHVDPVPEVARPFVSAEGCR